MHIQKVILLFNGGFKKYFGADYYPKQCPREYWENHAKLMREANLNVVRFKEWIKKKYKTIDTLNKEWGTIFWSQTYGNWDEVILPAFTVCDNSDVYNRGHNPGLFLDYSRFSSDSVVAYQNLQVNEICL